MPVTDARMSELSALVLADGAMGWPTIATLDQLNLMEIDALHDTIITGDLSRLAKPSWQDKNQLQATMLQDLLNTLDWPRRRELATAYLEERYRRDGAQRERRVERLTMIATITSLVALLVSAAGLLSPLMNG